TSPPTPTSPRHQPRCGSVQLVQVRAAVVVAEDLLVRLARVRHADRAHLAHADAVPEAGAVDHERVAALVDLEQRRLEAAQRAADLEVADDLDAALVTPDREGA